MNATDPSPVSNHVDYLLLLLKHLIPAILTRTAPLITTQQQIDDIKNTVCTGREHWRDRNKPGKTAKLYVIHSTDYPCPLHGKPEPGQRLRVYIGNKPQKIADALAAIERLDDYTRLTHDHDQIDNLITRTTYDITAIYHRLEYELPIPTAKHDMPFFSYLLQPPPGATQQ